MGGTVYTHPLHHGHTASSAANFDGKLLAQHGRFLAVAHLNLIDIYDIEDVVDLDNILGPGSCKFKLLSTVTVRDSDGPVDIHEIAYLTKGSLAVLGSTQRGLST